MLTFTECPKRAPRLRVDPGPSACSTTSAEHRPWAERMLHHLARMGIRPEIAAFSRHTPNPPFHDWAILPQCPKNHASSQRVKIPDGEAPTPFLSRFVRLNRYGRTFFVRGDKDFSRATDPFCYLRVRHGV